MNLVQCMEGHFYDSDRYFDCPFCNSSLINHGNSDDFAHINLIRHTVFQDEIIDGFGDRFCIGRDRNNANIVSSNLNVSRTNSLFLYKNDNWLIKDLNSTNGTYVNGTKINQNEEYVLKDGDDIDIAHSERFTFKLDTEKYLTSNDDKYYICIFQRFANVYFGCKVKGLLVQYNGLLCDESFACLGFDKKVKFYINDENAIRIVFEKSKNKGSYIRESRFTNFVINKEMIYSKYCFGNRCEIHFIISKEQIEPTKIDNGYINIGGNEYLLRDELEECFNLSIKRLSELKENLHENDRLNLCVLKDMHNSGRNTAVLSNDELTVPTEMLID